MMVRQVAGVFGLVIGGLLGTLIVLAIAWAVQTAPGQALELSGPMAMAALALIGLLVLAVVSLPIALVIAYALSEPASEPIGAAEEPPLPAPSPPAADQPPLAPAGEPAPSEPAGEAEAEAAGGWQVRVLRAEVHDRLAGADSPAAGGGATKARWLVLTTSIGNRDAAPAHLAPDAFVLVADNGEESPHAPAFLAYHQAERADLFSLEAPVPAGATVTTPLVFSAPRSTKKLSLRLLGTEYRLPQVVAESHAARASA